MVVGVLPTALRAVGCNRRRRVTDCNGSATETIGMYPTAVWSRCWSIIASGPTECSRDKDRLQWDHRAQRLHRLVGSDVETHVDKMEEPYCTEVRRILQHSSNLTAVDDASRSSPLRVVSWVWDPEFEEPQVQSPSSSALARQGKAT